MSPLRSPAVLHLPLCRFALSVEVDSHESHGVCRTAVECGDAVSLVHWECCREERTVVEVVDVAVSALAVEELAHVVRAVHLLAVLQRCDGEVGNLVHRQVEILPVVSVVCVAVEVHLVSLVVFAARVVHYHDECAVESLLAGQFLEERLRSVFLGLQRLAVLVFESECELCHRLAESEFQHVVDSAEHVGLLCLDSLLGFLLSHHLAQLQSVFAQF